MAKMSLTALAPLDGFSLKADGASCSSNAGFAMISLSVMTGQMVRLDRAVASTFGQNLPKAGHSIEASKMFILSSARDQFFIGRQGNAHNLITDIAKITKNLATITDQSDGWARLILSGPRLPHFMEKFCPINTNLDAFPVGSVARTSVDHLAIIVARLAAKSGDKHRFLVLTPRSSAASLANRIAQTPPFDH